ncbi:MAG TPA: hypothetical protein VJ914_16135 [Pseudonocardiaceae bacterium]|nr:hypothetical protein [Pseudonocardiaceae bacterium]
MTPSYLQPFVLPTEPATRTRVGSIDGYLPAGEDRCPAIVFVHGGPIPVTLEPPSEWPVYVGYGQAVAARGIVGVVFNHPLRTLSDYGPSAADLIAVIDAVRTHPRVDPERVALWFFSGGGPLATPWLDATTEQVRCLAFTYPLLGDRPAHPLDARFLPVRALADWQGVPIVLTRVGLERADVAETVAEFLAGAASEKVPVQVIDVPNGHHGFDFLDDSDESRAAITEAIDAVQAHLVAEGERVSER